MTVHIGRLTSEVTASGGGGGGGNSSGGDREELTPWEQQRQIAAAVNGQRCQRMRTATGYGDD
jgi:hypothetical protein